MSQFGMTPISILDKGPLGGFRGGMADQRSLMHSDSNLMTETLAQEAQRMQNETTQLNRPVDAVKRAAELAKLEEEMVLRQQGHFRDLANTELQTKKEDLTGKIDENQRKRYVAAAEGAMHAASIFSPDDDDATRASKWGTAVQIAKAAGLSNIPSDYSEYNYKRLMERAQAAPSAIKQMNEIKLKDIEAAHRTSERAVVEEAANLRHGEQLKNQKDIANIQAGATVQAAKERANAGEVYLRTEEQRALQAIETARKAGKPLDDGTVKQLAANAMQAAEAAVVKAKREIDDAKNAAARVHKDPAAAAEAASNEIRERVFRNYMSRADGLPVQENGTVIGKMEGGKIIPIKSATASKAATNDVPPVPTPSKPAATKEYKEGAIYRDPVTGVTKKYVNGGWVLVP